MILKKLTIYNFRSYYGKKEFLFSEHLNLILGSNGDGKTTFFDAVNWVLTPDYVPRAADDIPADTSSLVSAKMFNELAVGQKSRVIVSLELKNNIGQNRVVERAFDVFKNADGSMRIENRTHKAYTVLGSMRKEMLSVKDLFEKENVFPAVIKKYHIFKGEDKLNIFQDKTTLQTLIDMFSDVRTLDAYKDFAGFAYLTSNKAVEGIKDKSLKQTAKIKALQTDIVALTKQLQKAEKDLSIARTAYNDAQHQLESIDSDYEIIQQISKLEQDVTTAQNELLRLSMKTKEDYNINLLDSQWILLGFNPILKEYNRKMESLAYSKTNLELDNRRKQEDEYQNERIAKAKTELEKIAWNHHDIDMMKQMLTNQRCSYCGSAAAEGSVTYDFIKQRLNDVMNLLTPQKEAKKPVIKSIFTSRNIEAMKELGASLSYTGKDLSCISDEIESAYSLNQQVREEMAKVSARITRLKNNITKLYASSSSGEHLKEYVSNIAEVNKLHQKKQSSSLEMERLLSRDIPQLKEALKKKRDEQVKLNKASGVDPMIMVNDFFRMFGTAIEETESVIYNEFLERLSKEANVFLAMLNVDDFTGVIKIYHDRYNNLKLELQDKNNQVITNPNTSLLTTMHISILFAISELTRENRDAEYPLIFDAPTSSFDEGKDKTFYECLNSQVNRQCIVVTKSFLYKDDKGEFVTDDAALSKLNCRKYRIKKQAGFDKLDITTIDTVVEELKED